MGLWISAQDQEAYYISDKDSQMPPPHAAPWAYCVEFELENAADPCSSYRWCIIFLVAAGVVTGVVFGMYLGLNKSE